MQPEQTSAHRLRSFAGSLGSHAHASSPSRGEQPAYEKMRLVGTTWIGRRAEGRHGNLSSTNRRCLRGS